MDTTSAIRLLETSHPPTWYLPLRDARREVFVPGAGGSFCEFKGGARYYDLVSGARRVAQAAWFYPTPSAGFESLRDHICIYAGRVDACYVDDETVEPQPGGFYGGWITSDVVGPFKGKPGTLDW